MLDRIATVADPEQRRQLGADTANFGRLVLDALTMTELLRRYPAMPLYVDELPLYQDGLARGLEQGLEQGLGQGEALTLTRILGQRFPDLSAADRDGIAALDHATLDRLTSLVLEFATVDELRTWLSAPH